MKRTFVVISLLALGFLVKLSLVEAERFLHVSLVDECFAQSKKPMSQEQETACYESPRNHAGYRVVAFLSFQPQLWKNLSKRCNNPKDESYDYFDCKSWNRVAL